MEWIDLYDENGTPLGIRHNRAQPLPEGAFALAVGIWVFNSCNEILLTKRSETKSFAPGLWENTGGHVQAGEDIRTAVVRELLEETGISVSEEEVIYLGRAKHAPYFGENFCVRKDLPASAVRLQEGETCDVKWVRLPEFLEMGRAGTLAPSVFAHLEQYRESFYRELGA